MRRPARGPDVAWAVRRFLCIAAPRAPWPRGGPRPVMALQSPLGGRGRDGGPGCGAQGRRSDDERPAGLDRDVGRRQGGGGAPRGRLPVRGFSASIRPSQGQRRRFDGGRRQQDAQDQAARWCGLRPGGRKGGPTPAIVTRGEARSRRRLPRYGRRGWSRAGPVRGRMRRMVRCGPARPRFSQGARGGPPGHRSVGPAAGVTSGGGG